MLEANSLQFAKNSYSRVIGHDNLSVRNHRNGESDALTEGVAALVHGAVPELSGNVRCVIRVQHTGAGNLFFIRPYDRVLRAIRGNNRIGPS